MELSPEQIAHANAVRDAKKKLKLQRQKYLEHARAAFAKTINDKEGWPMPLTIVAAEQINCQAKKHSMGRVPSLPLLYVGQVFSSKNALLSRIMTYHEINKRRSQTANSRGLFLEQGCPFDDCKFALTASFKAIPATPGASMAALPPLVQNQPQKYNTNPPLLHQQPSTSTT